MADDLAKAEWQTDPRELETVRRFEERGIRSGRYHLLLTPLEALRFAEEAARHGIGTLGPNYWPGPGWEWWPAPDYSALVHDPDFVEKSIARLKEDLDRLPEGIAFIEIVLHRSGSPEV